MANIHWGGFAYEKRIKGAEKKFTMGG